VSKRKDYLELLIKIKMLDLTIKELNKQAFAMNQEIYDELEGDDEESVVVKIDEEDLKLSKKIKQGFKLIGELEGGKYSDPILVEWCKKNDLADIIKQVESVHHKTFEVCMKDLLDKHEPLPPFIEETLTPLVDVNKSAIERIAKERFERERQ
jgi:hypothetical protein